MSIQTPDPDFARVPAHVNYGHDVVEVLAAFAVPVAEGELPAHVVVFSPHNLFYATQVLVHDDDEQRSYLRGEPVWDKTYAEALQGLARRAMDAANELRAADFSRQQAARRARPATALD
jgi:hypothetical protein